MINDSFIHSSGLRWSWTCTSQIWRRGKPSLCPHGDGDGREANYLPTWWWWWSESQVGKYLSTWWWSESQVFVHMVMVMVRKPSICPHGDGRKAKSLSTWWWWWSESQVFVHMVMVYTVVHYFSSHSWHRGHDLLNTIYQIILRLLTVVDTSAPHLFVFSSSCDNTFCINKYEIAWFCFSWIFFFLIWNNGVLIDHWLTQLCFHFSHLNYCCIAIFPRFGDFSQIVDLYFRGWYAQTRFLLY